jgi:hypothetical protein
VHGKHVVLYSEHEGNKENLARLTAIKQRVYKLGVANATRLDVPGRSDNRVVKYY